MKGPCVGGSKPIFGSSTDDARLQLGVWEVRLPCNATEVGKMVLSGVLGLRKRAAETMGCGAALCRVFFERGCHGRTELMAWLRRRLGAGGPRCRTRVL
jgi:hypothetical protein